MNKSLYNILFAFVIMICHTSFSYANDEGGSNFDAQLYVTTNTLTAGENNQNIGIALRNSVDVTAIQFDITLPLDLEVEEFPNTDGETIPNIKLTTRKSSSHTINCNYRGDGRYTIVVLSMENESLVGNDGDVITINVNVPLTMNNNEDVALSNIHIVTLINGAQNIRIDQPDNSYNIHIKNEGGINTPEGSNIITAEILALHAGETGILNINMTNEDDICSFQFNIKLPDGISIVKENNEEGENVESIKLTERKQSTHNLSFKETKDSGYFLIAYSLSNSTFRNNDGAIVSMKVKSDTNMADGKYGIVISNVLMVTPVEKKFEQEDHSCVLTIKSLEDDIDDDDAPKLATFDFTDPENLNPAIEPGEEEDDYVNIASKTFSDEHIELVLDKGTRTQSYGSRIYTNQGYTYNIRVYSGATMEFTVASGNSSSITSITFEGAGVDALTPSVGTYVDGVWTGSAQSVTFTATGTNNIDMVTVEYLYDDAIILADTEIFANDEEQEDVTIKYRRNFTDTNWQPLFIPFAPSYEDWSENFDIARLNAFYEYNEQGESKKKIEFIIIDDNDAVLLPNHPYLIRAKEVGQKTIKSEHATLYTSDANQFDDLSCSTVETYFEIKGTYSNEESILGKYYVSNGKFWLDERGYNSLPYRWFISSQSKGAQYNHASAPAKARSIEISVLGSEEITGIKDVNATPVVNVGVKHSLDGRIINGEPAKGTIYIMNGHKYVK